MLKPQDILIAVKLQAGRLRYGNMQDARLRSDPRALQQRTYSSRNENSVYSYRYYRTVIS
jgi:hypothetical protein